MKWWFNVNWDNDNQSFHKSTFSWHTKEGTLGFVPNFSIWTWALKWRNTIEMLSVVKGKCQRWLSLDHTIHAILFLFGASLFSKFSTKYICYFGSQKGNKYNSIFKNTIYSVSLDVHCFHFRLRPLKGILDLYICYQDWSLWGIFMSIFRVPLYSGDFKGWQNCFKAFIGWNTAP